MPLLEAHFGGFFYWEILLTTFDKPALTHIEHIERLRNRKLLISDDDEVVDYLSNISYFRLSAYTRPFYLPNIDEHTFIFGTAFSDVIDLYLFDKELRLLLLDAIERIEVALRTQVANTLANHYGPHGYLDPNIFDNRYDHPKLLELIASQSKGRDLEAFISHYKTKYTGAPEHPPIWMAVELLTFKEISTLFSNLKLPRDTQAIETHFGWKFTLLKSWFRSMSDLRNLCAHHSRVWNREFGSIPEAPKRPPKNWPSISASISINSKNSAPKFLNPQRRLYFQLIVIQCLMNRVSPSSQWAKNLEQLFDKNPKVSKVHMGIPTNWKEQEFWLKAFDQ
jgi:abortive infection bacteriophage resistance protein